MSFAAIFFDLDNTLVDRDGAHRRYCDQFISQRAAEWSAADRERLLDEMVLRDQSGYCDRRDYFRELAREFPPLEIQADDLQGEYVRVMPALVEKNPEVCEMIDRLAKQYRLAIVSNGNGTRQRIKLRCADLLDRFEHIFISAEVRVKKPDPAIFTLACKTVRVPPEKVLFVGDNIERDIVGAANVGMTTCWVALGRSLPRDVLPDFAIDRIEDFESVL